MFELHRFSFRVCRHFVLHFAHITGYAHVPLLPRCGALQEIAEQAAPAAQVDPLSKDTALAVCTPTKDFHCSVCVRPLFHKSCSIACLHGMFKPNETTRRHQPSSQVLLVFHPLRDCPSAASTTCASILLRCVQAAAIHMCGDGSQDHSIESTFDVIFVTGWAPDPSQSKPARRGSATASFEDLQGAAEKVPAG